MQEGDEVLRIFMVSILIAMVPPIAAGVYYFYYAILAISGLGGY